MKREELEKILAGHELWLKGKGGAKADLSEADLRRADLRGANLSGANLSEADLGRADLRGANLRGANLREADLGRADLSEADLRGANLREADLRGAKGFILLPVQDNRGYSFCHAIETDSGWRVRVGCRDFSIAEAMEHWGESYSGEREQGDRYLYAVGWLKRKLGVGK